MYEGPTTMEQLILELVSSNPTSLQDHRVYIVAKKGPEPSIIVNGTVCAGDTIYSSDTSHKILSIRKMDKQVLKASIGDEIELELCPPLQSHVAILASPFQSIPCITRSFVARILSPIPIAINEAMNFQSHFKFRCKLRQIIACYMGGNLILPVPSHISNPEWVYTALFELVTQTCLDTHVVPLFFSGRHERQVFGIIEQVFNEPCKIFITRELQLLQKSIVAMQMQCQYTNVVLQFQ